MSTKLIATAKPIANRGRGFTHTEEIGACVKCKLGIFSDQEWGRAPKPLLGKAHTSCGGT